MAYGAFKLVINTFSKYANVGLVEEIYFEELLTEVFVLVLLHFNILRQSYLLAFMPVGYPKAKKM